MPNLALIDQPRTFPPKMFYLIVWTLTLALALYGIIKTTPLIPIWFVWLGVGLIALWQVWSIRWVQVDSEGIRMRNIMQRGRELRWEDVTHYHEEDLTLNKRIYTIIDISNRGAANVSHPTHIRLTSDQVGFDVLRKIVHEAAKKL